MKAKFLLLATLGFFAASPLAAQQPGAATVGGAPPAVPPGPWTLQAAVDYAIANNLTVRLNQVTAQTNAQILRQSRAALLPMANATATQTWNFGTGINPLTNQFQSQTVRANNFSAVSQVPLFQGFQLRNTIRRNQLDYQASQQDIEKSKNDLALNVASQYLQLVLAEELVRANQFRVNSDQETIARTRVLLRAGSIPESNLLDAQSQLATDQSNVVGAQNQADLARLALLQLLNLDPATTPRFELAVPNLPDPDESAPITGDLNQTYQTAAQNLPEIRAAELRVQSAGRSLDIARGAYLPRLTLAGSIFTGFTSTFSLPVADGVQTVRFPIFTADASGNPVAGAPFVAVATQPKFSQLPVGFFDQLNNNLGKQVQFVLNVPILNGLQTRTLVQRNILNEQGARLRAEQARLTLRQSIEQAAADARAAQLQYAAAKRQVEALQLTERNAEIRFNNGLLSGAEFNVTRNNYNFAVSSLLQAKYTFIFRRKVLDFYQGKPLAL